MGRMNMIHHEMPVCSFHSGPWGLQSLRLMDQACLLPEVQLAMKREKLPVLFLKVRSREKSWKTSPIQPLGLYFSKVSIVLYLLDYCSTSLMGCPLSAFKKFLLMQYAAARLLISVMQFDHILPLLFQMHWSPACFQI